jgi:hypothetical protein
MRTLILLCLLLGVGDIYTAQIKPFVVSNENLKTPRLFVKGNVINVQCDSVIVIDKAKHNQSLAAFNTTIKQFSLIKQQYDSCMLYASQSAVKLASVTAALAKNVTHTVDSAGIILRETRKNLTAATDNLNAANASLKTIEAILEREKIERRKKALAWGFGGFGAGIIVSSLVTLIVSQAHR